MKNLLFYLEDKIRGDISVKWGINRISETNTKVQEETFGKQI